MFHKPLPILPHPLDKYAHGITCNYHISFSCFQCKFPIHPQAYLHKEEYDEERSYTCQPLDRLGDVLNLLHLYDGVLLPYRITLDLENILVASGILVHEDCVCLLMDIDAISLVAVDAVVDVLGADAVAVHDLGEAVYRLAAGEDGHE